MKNITITVEVDGNAVSRDFNGENYYDQEYWGITVENMLDTIEKSKNF